MLRPTAGPRGAQLGVALRDVNAVGAVVAAAGHLDAECGGVDVLLDLVAEGVLQLVKPGRHKEPHALVLLLGLVTPRAEPVLAVLAVVRERPALGPFDEAEV
jgi:hypothetical protein